MSSHEFDMPNIEEEEEEVNEVYYMGDTDKQEYLENFKFKKSEEDDTSIIKNIIRKYSSSNNSLNKTSTSKENITEAGDTNSESKNNSNTTTTSEDKDSTETKTGTKSSTDALSDTTSTTKQSTSNLSDKKQKMKKGSVDLDDEDQTQARYVTMKKNEIERKEIMEKARQKRELLQSRDNGKFSRSALLSLLQQYGESLSAELFDQYINELLKDNSTNYKQLEEFFTLDEFVRSVLSFEEELVPETRIEKLNRGEKDEPITVPSTADSTDTQPQTAPISEIGDISAWMVNDNYSNYEYESDTEPFYVSTE